MNQNHFLNKIRANPLILFSGLTVLGFLTWTVYQFNPQNNNNLLTSNKSTNKPTKTITSSPSISTENIMILAGSGTNLSITRNLATEFAKSHPHLQIKIPSSIGSTGGINALIDGQITVALASRSLKEEEKQFGLRVIPYAQTAVVIGAHPSVTDENITFTDLIDIYKGTKTRWSDGQEIIVLSREPGDSSNLILEKNIPGFKQVYAQSQKAKRWQTFFTDQENNHALANTRFAIGLSDTGLIANEQPNIKVLKVNGIAPTAENVINGKYPLTKVLSFILAPGEISPNVQAFLDFVRSSEGEKILKAHGYFLVR